MALVSVLPVIPQSHPVDRRQQIAAGFNNVLGVDDFQLATRVGDAEFLYNFIVYLARLLAALGVLSLFVFFLAYPKDNQIVFTSS
jgi:hypothetical protein